MDELLYPIEITPAESFDARRYPQVEVQASGVTGTWQPQRSLDPDNNDWENASGYSNNPTTIGNEVTTITADGFFVFEGGCWIKFTGGSAGTFYIRGIA